MVIKGLAPESQGRLARVLRGSAAAVLTALMLAGCSGTPEPEVPASAPHLRLMSTEQYVNTLAHIFGPSIDLDVSFPPLQRTSGLLANGAAFAGITASQLELFQRAAAGVAGQVVDTDHRNFLIPCKPASEEAPDDACAAKFIKQTGRLLHRRALTDAQVDQYVKEASASATKLKDFYKGLGTVLEGMLISPDVLFIVEKSEPDPEQPGKQRLDAYSLASRLSFFLWNSGPDDELLKAAENGDLQTEDGLEEVVDRMLASPRLKDGVRAFFDDMFAFDDFATLSKDPTVYPYFTGATVADAREQTLRTVVDHLITKNGDYRDLYTTRSTFISPALAALYHMPAPRGWAPYTFPEGSARVGILTQVSFLAVHSHPGRSSPTRRGKALRELLLCQTVPPPPPNVDFSIVENPNSHYPTQRDRVKAHLQSPACAGCHRITDPTGLALENFDGAGRFRVSENGVDIDTSGNLDGKKFDDVIGLTKALHDNPGLPKCLVRRLYSYGSGEAAATTERPLLDYFNTQFAENGYKLPDLMRAITLSYAFSHVSKGKAVPAGTPAPQDGSQLPRQQLTMSQSSTR